MQQWQETIKKYTYLNDDDIKIIKGRVSIEKTMKKHDYKKFYIASTDTLAIAANEDLLDKFLKRILVGVCIIDEAHEMLQAITLINLKSNINHNFYLTATPQRSDSKENRLYTLITTTIPMFGGYTVGQQKFVNVKKIYIKTNPSAWDQRRIKTMNGFSSILYEKFIFRNEERRYYFINIMIYLSNIMLEHDKDAKVLIVLSGNDNIELASIALKNLTKRSIGKFNSRITDMEEKQEELNNNIILSTIKSMGAGMDVKNLRAIINFVPFRSHILLHQLMGRLRKIEGKAVFYFDIVDTSFQDTNRFSFIRDQFFKIHAASITNKDLSMYEAKDKVRNLII